MAEPIQVDFSGKGGRKEAVKKPIAIPPERAGLRLAACIAGTVLTAVIGYYVMLPPLNFKATELYLYLAVVIGSFVALVFMTSNAGNRPEYVPYVRKTTRYPILVLVAVGLFFALAMAFSSPLFHAARYSELMPVNEEANFSKDIAEPDFLEIPKLDESAARIVADRALGDLADYVSQFVISESNTQINYQQKPVRVVPLSYASAIKWLTNTSQGLPGYVIVDMANEKSEFVKLDQRIRYSDAEHFGKLLKRHLRFQYPTYMFGIPNFEIDDAGKPYWIAPRMDKKIGLLGGEDIVGIVLVDAVSGECVEYSLDRVRSDKNLQWIDRVFSASLVTTQYNYYGKYNSGFWNSLLGQKNVKGPTVGFNYLAKDDDVFMYTGVTSVTADQSIIGFILVNQRTKEANYYRVSGATESSAMTTAEGLVQAQGWRATFPLLINVSGQPTYFLSLKDDSGVLQGYSMVNVTQYNKVKVWAGTVAECTRLYVAALEYNGLDVEAQPPEEAPDARQSITGRIAEIRSEVVGGNTAYYIRLEDADVYYTLTAARQRGAVLLNEGDQVTIAYTPAEGSVLQADEILIK